MVRRILLLMVAIALAACTDDTMVAEPNSSPAPPSAPSLELENATDESHTGPKDGRFVATSILVDGEPREIGVEVDLVLEVEGDAMYSRAGCNWHSMTYTTEDHALVVSGLNGTMEECRGPIGELESFMVEFIRSEPMFSGDEQQFALSTSSTTIHFTNFLVVYPDLPLVGTSWAVVGFGDSSSFSTPGGAPTTIRFSDEGRAEGNDGCVDYSIRVTIGDDEVRFPEVITNSRRGCDSLSYAKSDRFRDMLPTTMNVEITSSTLRLTRGEEWITFEAID